MTTFWPGTNIRRSRGNGFDLEARRARGPSIFANLTSAQPASGSKGGRTSVSVEPVVQGLSERARRQLKATGPSIAVSKSDPDKGNRIRKASI